MQARISIGTIYRLQDWDGTARKANSRFAEFEGLEFSGEVAESNLEVNGVKSSEIKSILKYRPRNEE